MSWTLFIAGSTYTIAIGIAGYYIGQKIENNKFLKRTVVDLIDTVGQLKKLAKDQEERQVNHENRLEEINTNSITPPRISELLSAYPPENKATNAASSERS